ncbi:MAG: YopX family protein [Clostridia bacterium]|nr:YopX family protein [Clostridia bacterium]
MREIKFRLWNDYDKKMLNWSYLLERNLANIFTLPSYKKWLMQYTGLKDKNGKEIYEGDIVRTHYIGEIGVENDEVIFDRGCFCVNYSEDYHPLLNEVNHCSEVIGNIYENPELLEDK